MTIPPDSSPLQKDLQQKLDQRKADKKMNNLLAGQTSQVNPADQVDQTDPTVQVDQEANYQDTSSEDLAVTNSVPTEFEKTDLEDIVDKYNPEELPKGVLSVFPDATLYGRRILKPLGEGAESIILLVEGLEGEPKYLDAKVTREQLRLDGKSNSANQARVLLGLQGKDGMQELVDYIEGEHGLKTILTEHIDGVSLRSQMDELYSEGLAIPELDAIKLAIDICEQLEYAHNEREHPALGKVIHRDINPKNVLIDNKTGRARLIDFGIAKPMAETMTHAFTTIGTFQYMAPEQFGRLEEVGPHTDVYGLTSTLTEVVLGKFPKSMRRTGDSASLRLSEESLDLPESISPELRKILVKGQEFEIENRHQTITELKEDLKMVYGQLSRKANIVLEEATTATLDSNEQELLGSIENPELIVSSRTGKDNGVEVSEERSIAEIKKANYVGNQPLVVVRKGQNVAKLDDKVDDAKISFVKGLAGTLVLQMGSLIGAGLIYSELNLGQMSLEESIAVMLPATAAGLIYVGRRVKDFKDSKLALEVEKKYTPEDFCIYILDEKKFRNFIDHEIISNWRNKNPLVNYELIDEVGGVGIRLQKFKVFSSDPKLELRIENGGISVRYYKVAQGGVIKNNVTDFFMTRDEFLNPELLLEYEGPKNNEKDIRKISDSLNMLKKDLPGLYVTMAAMLPRREDAIYKNTNPQIEQEGLETEFAKEETKYELEPQYHGANIEREEKVGLMERLRSFFNISTESNYTLSGNLQGGSQPEPRPNPPIPPSRSKYATGEQETVEQEVRIPKPAKRITD